MTELIELATDRLKLRQWKDDAWPAFAEINADPAVMEFCLNTQDENESNHTQEICQRFLHG